ncbi:CDP-glycerol glycerophosphotransferase, TagB/SpsB family [Virgibacillus subterraneus]|uniref:CDP-glycerol glycerophosphotransferase, TagB/SpsB family n=1 Tax=Virgibacillus subterraneus TaxID=621109 RepID=A0A1H9AEW9_9BACI|nr:CDP-glycerol glycerophosphotransferase family protein [Virgibacillus subterraneus]SEP75037.1 CDP-glycerol glycerophosphotransferase, TagB/SpsB family [Virgibacillus subterraneus]
MVRELVISIYLYVLRTFFNLFKLFPRKHKTTFVASFGINIIYTINELEKQTDHQVVILKTPQCKNTYEDSPRRTILKFGSLNIIDWVRSIYHLATSKIVFVDNYYGFLSMTKFRPNTQCIQLWHAAGAIKRFGLMDRSIENRHPRACVRFKNVYKRFDYVVAGSEKMTAIFGVAFDLSEKQILRTGIPRTDFFFDTMAINKAEQSLLSKFPIINEKKVILYAPTYRANDLDSSELKLDIERLYNALKNEYVLFLSLHPKVKSKLQNDYPYFVFDISSYRYLNHLLVISDILITDYSSIPFEFSLLSKPMVFFAYDLEEYAHEKGFWENYEELVPGPVVKHTDALIDVLKAGEFDMERVRAFADEWNQYSRGESSERLIKALYKQ